MWVQTQSVPGRSQLQLSASPRRTESAKSSSSPALSRSQGTFLDTDDETSANVRDSLVSILDDPFLIGYTTATEEPQPPTTATTATTATTTPTATSTTSPGKLDNRNASRQAWPPPRKESLTNQSPTPWVCYACSTHLPVHKH